MAENENDQFHFWLTMLQANLRDLRENTILKIDPLQFIPFHLNIWIKRYKQFYRNIGDATLIVISKSAGIS